MSFYRTLIAAIAAVVIASPIFATSANQASHEAAAPVSATQNSTEQTASAEQAAPEADKVNVNAATAKQLMKVRGLSGSKAKAIVAYRKKHGNFKSLDELAKVKGFTKMKADQLKSIQDQLSLS